MGRFRLEIGRNSALHRDLCPEAARGTARGHTQEDNDQEEDKENGHQASVRQEIRVPDGDVDQEEPIEDLDPQGGYGQDRRLPSQEDCQDVAAQVGGEEDRLQQGGRRGQCGRPAEEEGTLPAPRRRQPVAGSLVRALRG